MEEELKEYELKKNISKFLYEMKMKNTSLGFCYWLNAISYSILQILNDNHDIAKMGEIYKYIAQKYNTSIDCVEKAMRYAKEESKYKDFLKVTNNLKNYDFLTLCIDNIISKMFHK